MPVYMGMKEYLIPLFAALDGFHFRREDYEADHGMKLSGCLLSRYLDITGRRKASAEETAAIGRAVYEQYRSIVLDNIRWVSDSSMLRSGDLLRFYDGNRLIEGRVDVSPCRIAICMNSPERGRRLEALAFSSGDSPWVYCSSEGRPTNEYGSDTACRIMTDYYLDYLTDLR